MYDWGYGGYDMWGFIVMVFMMALVAVGIVLVVRYLSQGNGTPRPSQSALDVLKMRYAKGELSKDEFEKMKKDIQ